MGYAEDRKEGDRYLPLVQGIIGPLLLIPAPLEIDTKQATDLIVIYARPLTIGVRIRRPGYFEKWRYEFTIRSRRDSGAETELTKVMRGWCDWFFYGHAEATDPWDPPLLRAWYLINMDSLRYHYARDGWLRTDQRHLSWGETPNGDGTHFAWFDLRSFPPDPPILLAASEPVPNQQPSLLTFACELNHATPR